MCFSNHFTLFITVQSPCVSSSLVPFMHYESALEIIQGVRDGRNVINFYRFFTWSISRCLSQEKGVVSKLWSVCQCLVCTGLAVYMFSISLVSNTLLY